MWKNRKGYLLGAAVVIMLSGCNKKNTPEKPVSTPQPSFDVAAMEQEIKERREKAEAEEYVNCFDVVKIAQSIKINKKNVTFPMQLSDFGKDVYFGEMQEINDTLFQNNKYSTTITDGKTNKAMVKIYSTTDTKDDAQIYSFEADVAGNLNIQIAGVSFGATVNSVIAAMGEPLHTNGDEEDVYRIYYENCEYEYLALVFENKKLSTIAFCYLPKELRY